LLRLALSQKILKRASIWPTSPRSSIVCPIWFSSLWYVSLNPCTYLAPWLTLSRYGPKWASTWPTSPRTHVTKNFHRVCPKRFSSLLHVRCKSCTNLAWRLTLSPNGPIWASIWPTSPRTSFRHDHKAFHARGTFGANRASILRRD
jgi:hypothetical protein